jgi:hypothetical protein
MKRSRRHYDELADRLASGDTTDDARDLRRFVERLRGEDESVEGQSDLAATLAAEATVFAETASRAPEGRTSSRPLPAEWRRRAMIKTFMSTLAAKLILGGATVAVAAGGGMAATGTLPDPAQEFAARTAARVGLELPHPSDEAADQVRDQERQRDRERSRTASGTAEASGTAGARWGAGSDVDPGQDRGEGVSSEAPKGTATQERARTSGSTSGDDGTGSGSDTGSDSGSTSGESGSGGSEDPGAGDSGPDDDSGVGGSDGVSGGSGTGADGDGSGTGGSGGGQQ